MQVTIEIHDNIAQKMGSTPEAVGRKLLEQYALDEYNAWRFGHYQVQLLLGFNSWQETEKFLRDNHAPLQYGVKELEEDRRTLDRILGPK